MANSGNSEPDDSRLFYRMADIQKEEGHWLLPIQGYENMPLVSLEEATKPLIGIVSDIERSVFIAKKICQNPSDGLSVDQSGAIMLYTMEWEPREKCPYFVLNASLREKNRSGLKPWFLYMKLLLTALDKLPSSTCVVFRGVRKQMKHFYPLDSIVIWWGFSSCTTNITVLQSDNFLGKTGPRTMFSIKCYSGKNIQKHSYFDGENEFLLPPARQLRVVGVLDQGNDLFMIQLEEVESEISLLGGSKKKFDVRQPSASRRSESMSDVSYQNSVLNNQINRYSQLNNINLTFQNLIDDDMPIVVQSAIIQRQCKQLDLSKNRISANGVAILAKALQNNTTMETLSICDNNLSDDAIFFLIDALSGSNGSLKELGLGTNKITDLGVNYLVEILKKNSTLTTLGLNNNSIGNSGLQLLMSVLVDNNRSLKILNVSCNKLIDDTSIPCILNMFQMNHTLQEFHMVRCNLSVSGIRKLRTAVTSKANFQLNL